jgi:hypothetical protein
MIPGGTLLKRCQACQGSMCEPSMQSGNTKGAQYWTDGRMLTPRLIITPSLIKCPHCNAVQWLKDLEEIHSHEGSESALQPRFKEATFEDLWTFANKTIEQDTEQRVRLHAWRAGNDARRHSKELLPLNHEEVQNLNLIFTLMNESQQTDDVLKAEILRELGQLDAASEAIKGAIQTNNEVAHFIFELIEQKQIQVIEIKLDEEFDWRMKNRLRQQQNRVLPDLDRNGPPLFEIKTRDWWVKVLGMLSHNWALLEDNNDHTVTIYFFHDLGTTLCGNAGYAHHLLDNRCAVVDSLNFQTKELALQALRVNGFCNLNKSKKFLLGQEPCGHFYDARASEEGIYSKKSHWIYI